MKKIRKILALALAVFMLVGLMPTNVFAEDTREKISKVTATTSPKLDSIIGFAKNRTKPKFTITFGAPAYFYDAGGDWQKKNGANWEYYYGETFEEGTYRYAAQIRVDGDAGKTHVLERNVKVTVDGKAWEYSIANICDDYSYALAYSQEFEVKDTREKISTITASSNIASIVGFDKSVQKPTFNIIDGSPAYFYDNTASWRKMNGGNWEVYTGTTFTEGIYKYNIQVRVDDAENKYVVNKDGVNVTVDGNAWNCVRPEIFGDYSFVWATSQAFEVKDSSTPLTVTSIKVNSTRHKTEYKVDEPLDVKDLTIEATMSDGTKPTITVTSDMVTDFDTSAPATNKAVTINYQGQTTTYNINVTVKEDHDVNINPAIEHGKVTASPTKAKMGETVTLTITPDDGYIVDEISVMDEGASNVPVKDNKFTMPDMLVNVTVTFKPIPVTPLKDHDISINTPANGTASLSKDKAKKGDVITVTATPAAGYELDKIKVDGTEITGNTFTMPDKDVAVEVTFKPIPVTPLKDHDISINTPTNGTASLSKDKAKKGDVITVTATPNANYELDKIKVDGTEITGNTFTMPDKDVTVTVTFKEKTGTPPTPPTPPTPEPPTPTPTPDPYYPGYDDWYKPYRPHRPHRPSKPVEEKKSEEKPIDKPAKKVETEVILTIGSNNLDNKINGVDSFKGMDVAPYIKNGRTMLPIRYVAEALGMSVSWDAKTRTVIISDMFYTVEIPVDTNKIIVNGDVFTSDVKPEIVHGRTMMPIANIARALGLKDGKDIIWDASMRQVIIKRIYDK